MNPVVTVTNTLFEIVCPKCRGAFAISKEWRDEASRRGKFEMCYVCPYCQESRGWGEGEADILKAKLQEEEARVTRNYNCAENALKEAAHFRQSRDEIAKKLAAKEKRARNGVCHECNRTFPNLAEHMQSCHCGKDAAVKQSKTRKPKSSK